MPQERVKCPFCSELILRDAIKCRFCGEWFSRPDQDVEAVSTIQDSNLEDFGAEHHRLVSQNTQNESTSFRVDRLRGRHLPDAIKNRGEKQVEKVEAIEEDPDEVAPVRIAREIVQAEKAGLDSVREGSRTPWLRYLLLVFYLGIVVALVVAEFKAHKILNEARVQEIAGDVNDVKAAFAGYRAVQDIFPFTFAEIEARKNLIRLGKSQGFELTKPAWLADCENLLGGELREQDVHLLPLMAWPISALILFLVFVTRIRRFGVASVAFILMILAILGSVVQLAWFGLVPAMSVTGAVEQFMQAPEALYIVSYTMLILTAFMTLTATVSRINLQIAKMTASTATKR